MSWRDVLLAGSFRGVPFEIESASRAGQPKRVVHEYPQSDKTEIEYLGRGTSRFTLRMFVVTRDNFEARNALEAALDEDGPGELVHPYRGTLQVAVLSWQTLDSKDDGGLSIISAEFILDAAPSLPATSIDQQALTEQLADSSSLAAQDDFVATFDVASVTENEISLATLKDGLTAMASAVDSAYIAVDAVNAELRRVILDPILDARSTLQDLINLPADLAARVSGFASSISSAANLDTLFSRYSSASSDGSYLPLGKTNGSTSSDPYGAIKVPPAAAEAAPALSAGAQAARDRIWRLLRTAVVIQRAKLTASTEYVSAQAAQADILIVSDQVDAAIVGADDITIQRLRDLRASVYSDLVQRAADARLYTEYTPAETLPVLVIAHRLYGPSKLVENAEDIIARNHLLRPGLVSGGTTLEVLTP